MGSPRVGKSELINALCDGNQAETSSSLDSCTQNITCYTLEDDQQRNPSVKPFKINFYDTPGIESWEKKAGELTMIEFIEKTNPVCMIYCASPGSYANLNQLHSILEYCQSKGIFCALVCTNMWSSSKRHDVIKDFERQLAFFGDKVEKESVQGQYPSPHKIIFFGKDALCTMVNSKEYSDKDLLGNQTLPVQGIDELIHGIMEGLDQEKILGWCYAVLYRRSYWEKIQQKVGGFFQLRFVYLYNLISLSYEETAKNFAVYFQKKET
jgi:GTP-binding protein EngB required for normal cell division